MSVPGAGITRFAVRGTTRLTYEDVGDPGAPAAIFLHDLLADRSSLRPLADAVRAAGARVILIDARGHGASAALSSRPYPPTELAGDVLAVLDTAGVEAADVIAEGWGGATVIAVARMAPQRVRSLVLIQPDLPGVLASDDDARSRWAWHSARERLSAAATAAGKGLNDRAVTMVMEARRGPGWEETLDRASRGAMKRNAPALAAVLSGAEGHEPAPEAIAALAMPALVISGTNAVETDHLVARRLAASLPQARLLMIETTPPLPLPDASRAEMADAVLTFLTEVPGRD